MSKLFEDKQIVNPMNPEEVFTCQELTDDYKVCRREKRMQTSNLGKRLNCTEYRKLGKYASRPAVFISLVFFLQPTSASTWRRTSSSTTSWSGTTRNGATPTGWNKKGPF